MMRANITTEGCLEILPENEIEEYALKAWFADDGTRRPVMKIKTMLEQFNEAQSLKEIE
jgi:hypothetical protein